MPYVWLEPLATSLALYLSTFPSRDCLAVNTHLHPTVCLHGGNDTMSHVSFFFRAWNSSCIAFSHMGFCLATCQLLDTCTKSNDVRKDLYAGGTESYDM